MLALKVADTRYYWYAQHVLVVGCYEYLLRIPSDAVLILSCDTRGDTNTLRACYEYLKSLCY